MAGHQVAPMVTADRALWVDTVSSAPWAVPVSSPSAGCVPPLPPHQLRLGQGASPGTLSGGRCPACPRAAACLLPLQAEVLGDLVAVREQMPVPQLALRVSHEGLINVAN